MVPFESLTSTHLHDVLLELGGHGLLKLGGNASDLVLVRASLESGEDCLVDLGTEVALVLETNNREQAAAVQDQNRRHREGED